MDLLFSNLHIILDILLRYMVNLLLGFYRACKPAWWLCFHGIRRHCPFFFFFTISKERREAGEGAYQWRSIHFICGNYWHTWLGWNTFLGKACHLFGNQFYLEGCFCSFLWATFLLSQGNYLCTHWDTFCSPTSKTTSPTCCLINCEE